MSYLIHIWESPVPASIDEARRFIATGASDVVGQNPKFIELAAELTAGFPCITTLEPHDNTGVWIDGPLDGITATRCYVLGIARHFWQVRRHILLCAGRLGLTCFDTQNMLLFLPDRSILPAGTILSTQSPCRLTEDDVLREFGLMLEHAGFALDAQEPYTQSRMLDGCWQGIFLLPLNRFGKLEMSITLSLKWMRHPVVLDFNTEFFCDGPHTFRAWDSDTGANAMVHLKRFILEVVLPFLDQCTSLEYADRLLNAPLRNLRHLRGDWLTSSFGALYAAHRVGNPRFDDLVAANYFMARRHYRYCAWPAMQRWVALLRSGTRTADLVPDAVLAATERDLNDFVDAYGGARRGEIALAPDCGHGIGFVDDRSGWRHAVIALVLRRLASTPLALLADLLVAEAMCSRGQLKASRYVTPLALILLARAGSDGLDAIGVVIGCGTALLAAVKTIDLPPQQAALLDAACRQRAAAAPVAKMKARWLDLAAYFGEPSPAQPRTGVAAFAAAYTSAQIHRIDCKWNGKLPAPGEAHPGLDLNHAFREAVLHYAEERTETVPMALLCDLFIAEAHYLGRRDTFFPRAMNEISPAPVTQAMLRRGGLRELALFETAQMEIFNLGWPFDQMALPGDKGPALAQLCRERSALAACPERRYIQLKLAQFFDLIPNEVPPAPAQNQGGRPKA